MALQTKGKQAIDLNKKQYKFDLQVGVPDQSDMQSISVQRSYLLIQAHSNALANPIP
jgi:hypothetical protein